MAVLNPNFWESRYTDDSTGWDLGKCSAPLQDFFRTLEDKEVRILIPGCGNAHEAEYLHRNGFNNVFVADWAKQPLDNLKRRVESFPTDHLLHVDFFELSYEFDLIIEQTFFCAIDPRLRTKYVNKTHQILAKEGRIVGVMFHDIPRKDGPPYGGSITEYQSLFEQDFDILKIEKCSTSEKSRQGQELFVMFQKK